MAAPKPPDPAATADAQKDINLSTALAQFGLGATNQTTPQGSLSYSQIGTWQDGTPRYQATSTLNPQSQALYDQLMSGASTAAGQVGQGPQAPNLHQTFGQSGAIPSSINTGGLNGLPGLNTQGLPQAPNAINYSGLPGLSSTQFQTSLNTSGLSQLPTNGDYSQDRQRVEESIMSRLKPQIAAGRQTRESDLVNRGVRPGTEAYDRAMKGLAEQENDLRLQTVLAGGQEQSRMFADALAGRQQGYGERLSSGQFTNDARSRQRETELAQRGMLSGEREHQALFGLQSRGQQFGERQAVAADDVARRGQLFGERQAQGLFGLESQAQRFGQDATRAGFANTAKQQGYQNAIQSQNLPIEQLVTLLGGTGSGQVGGMVNTPQPGVAGVDYAGLVQNQYDQQMQRRQNIMSGLFGLGGTIAGMFSDRRLKSDVRKLWDDAKGIAWYAYTIFGKPAVGVMADEVVWKVPGAVGIGPDGYFRVNYGML